MENRISQTLPEIFVGSYTDGGGKGLSFFSYDPDTGYPSRPKLVEEYGEPSFLCFSEDGEILYTFDNREDAAYIVILRCLPGDDCPEEEQRVRTPASSFCHVSLVKANGAAVYLALSAYEDGSVLFYPLDGNGRVKDSPACSGITERASTPNARPAPMSTPHLRTR